MQGLSQYFAYQYDPSGNVFSITDHADYSWRVFYYDNLSRLTLERKSNGTALSYNYDSIGNLTHKEGRDFYYGQAFGVRPHALSSISDGSSFRYDANGNLTEEYMPQRGKARHYYDAENRLIKITPESSEMSFTLYLRPGWNFVSLPVIPKDARILEVLKSLNFGSDYDQVARYNPENKTWEMFRNEPEYDQFNTLEYGRGYQIYVTNPGGVQLTVSGYLSSVPTSIPVSAGWNLVGYPFWQDSKTVEPGLSPLLLGADYSLLERYNADRGAIEKYSGSQKDFLQLNKGEGYFLKAARNTSWLIPEQNAGVGQMVTQTEFVYDAQGARVKKNTPQGLTTYIGGIFEKDSSGTFRKHIFAGSLRICSIITNPANLTSSTIYYLPDHLGSTQVITDSSGRILEKVAYSSFGEHTKTTLNSTNSMNSTNYFFTGKELDATTKLYYYGARYYHPSIARFTQPDPLEYSDMGIRLAGGENLKIFLKNPQNFNRYSYCLNNPLKYIDSYGLLTIYIPGTFSDYKTPKYDFMDTATKSFKDNYGFAALSWSGRDTFIAQANAALSLANFINNYNFASNENLNIVGFSHGGNIGLMASRLIWNHKIDNLVLLATPIRGYKMNRENIGKIYNNRPTIPGL
jgi:RHS repeat-associated protein